MMKTPICSFVDQYLAKSPVRFHMPGHKGSALLGPEARDITEIDGADVLYHARGIIAESEQNAAALFGTYRTFYSCEGSSLCIRAMLALALMDAERNNRSNRVVAARCAHQAFLSAAALLDFPITWLYPCAESPCAEGAHGLLSCHVTPEQLTETLSSLEKPPAAVYITSPDYLGCITDIRALADVCHRHHTILLCDNAHGAYLHFLPASMHPADLGADLCCDSAHKTLPALTGAAYLHIPMTTPHAAFFAEQAERALSMFASSSPSYLILQSLDAVNAYLADGYREKVSRCIARISESRAYLAQNGYTCLGEEPMKLTVAPKSRGYTGSELASILCENNMIPEFSDPDYLVLMITPEMPGETLQSAVSLLASLPARKSIPLLPPAPPRTKTGCSVRKAMFAPAHLLPIEQCVGRILAAPGVSCPPAIPIVICGEIITEEAVNAFRYYGIRECMVMEETLEGCF